MSVERVASIGECMVELRETEPGRLVRSFGGDTLNTAVYLARCLSGTDVGPIISRRCVPACRSRCRR